MAKKDEVISLTNDQAKVLITEAAEDMEKKLGPGARIVVMVQANATGYCWATRGDTFGVLGMMAYVSEKIRAWVGELAK